MEVYYFCNIYGGPSLRKSGLLSISQASGFLVPLCDIDSFQINVSDWPRLALKCHSFLFYELFALLRV